MRDPNDPILIAGAGCAGLSLAVELQQRGYGGKVIIVDPRTEYGRDHTWCHYLTRHHAFESCISHLWNHWRVRTVQGDAVASSTLYPYAQISSERFYAQARSIIEAASGYDLRLGTSVESIEPGSDSVRVRLSDGSVFRVAAVFDSRPAAGTRSASASDVTLLQQFAGLHVKCDCDVFTPDTAEMMDFRLTPGEPVQFMYVLPYSEREALIEATVFTRVPLDRNRLTRMIFEYLDRRCSTHLPEVIHSEYGCIPMTTARIEARPHPRVIRIGLSGGAAKPSTGYAFGAIQSSSAQLAEELSAGISPARVSTPHYRSRRSRFLDDVFLCYLARHPSKAAGIFRGIFQNCSGDRIARFLTDAGTIADDLSIIAAMPKIPFMLEGVRSFRIWSQSAGSDACTGLQQRQSKDARLIRQGGFIPSLR